MKTSKRLLSILLMLTMLLSMFTVMASADGAKDAPATHEHTLDTLKKVDEVPATCVAAGVKEHYRCTVEGCNKLFEMEGTNPKEVTQESLVIPKNSNHQNNGLQPAQEATCTTPKKLSYYYCTLCGLYWYYPEGDSTGKGTYNEENLYVGDPNPNAHKLTKTPEKAATCTAPGTKAYWTCSICNKSFANEAGTEEIKDLDAWKVVSKLDHKLTKVEAKAATTTKKGNIEYYKCEACGKLFNDDKATKELTEKDVELDKIPTYTVTVTKGSNGSLKYRVNRGNDKGTWETITDETKIIKDLLTGDKVEFLAEPKKNNYKTVWTVNGTKLNVDDNTRTLTITENLTVDVSFQRNTDLELEVQVFGSSHGEVYYRYNKEDSEKLKTTSKTWDMDATTDKVKFWVYPDSGYKAVLQFNDGRKVTYTYGDSVEIDHYDLEGEDGVLSISFVKKSSSDVDDYPTLTFDITGGKHGTVYRGTREYEDGDVISIKKNDKMTFKAKTDKGYVAVWTYKGDTYVGDEYTVKMGANDAKLYVEFMDKDDIRLTELPFRDVSKRDWYYDDVVYVYRKGYMDGMSSTRFGGELNTTRGQIVTILWRLTGEPRATKRNPFTDVSSSQYYYDAISWAYDAGVVDGFDARTFKPDQNVTREQLAAILYRYAEYMNLSTSGSAYLAKYRDADKIANWAYDAMAWANYRGLINGTSATRIDPKGYATRAQIAAILHRFAVEYGA